MNTPISFPIAKLLKEKGFKPTKLFGYISKFYNPNTKTLLAYGRTGKTDLTKAYYAPTIAEVVMWLYEKHGIWISVWQGRSSENFGYRIQGKESFYEVNYFRLTPTEAYEAAIGYTLNNLI